MEDIEIEKGVLLTGTGLAVFKQLGLAVAADLHIGFEEASGEELARLQTKMMLSKCLSVLEKYELKEIVLNGDLKYSFGKDSQQEWDELQQFLGEISKRAKIWIVKGNHDNYIENIVRDMPIMVSEQFDINGVLFCHGDEEIKRDEGKLVVIGNEHPSIRLRDEVGVVKKYPCFLYAKEEKVLVLPSINPWAPGTDVLGMDKRNFLSPVLHDIRLNAANVYPIESGLIYDFKNVGDVKRIMRARRP